MLVVWMDGSGLAIERNEFRFAGNSWVSVARLTVLAVPATFRPHVATVLRRRG